MNPIPGYETAQAYDGNYEVITPGGHVCRILGARVSLNQYVDNNPEQIEIQLEICEGSNLDGINARRFEASKKRNPNTQPKWPCIYSTFTHNREGECSGYFKGLITSIEESNDGFKWAWNELALKGKLVGVIFREEEFLKNDGSIGTTCKPFQIRSVETIRAGVEVPEVKRYESKSNSSAFVNNSSAFANMQEVDDDELPF